MAEKPRRQAVRKVPFRKSLRVVYYRQLPYLYIFFEYAILRGFAPRFRINTFIEMDIFAIPGLLPYLQRP